MQRLLACCVFVLFLLGVHDALSVTRIEVPPPPPPPKTPAPTAAPLAAICVYEHAAVDPRPQQALTYFAQADFFLDVLTTVNFNHGHLDSLGVWGELYGDVFANVLIMAPRTSPKAYVWVPQEYADDPGGEWLQGRYGMAIDEMPGYRGYLFMHDDLVVDPIMLLPLNRSKLWHVLMTPREIEPVPTTRDAVQYWKPKEAWVWYERPVGLRALRHLFADPTFVRVFAPLIAQRCGAPNYWWHGLSDFLYVPMEHAKLASKWFRLTARHRVMLELAVPQFVMCILDPDDRLQIRHEDIGPRTPKEARRRWVPGQSVTMHAVKYSDPAMAAVAREVVAGARERWRSVCG